jgi:putative hydrolase of the HAD superfamily
MAIFVFDFDGVIIQSRRPNGGYLWNEAIWKSHAIPLSLLTKLFSVPRWTEALCGRKASADIFKSVLSADPSGVLVEEFTEAWLTSDLQWRPEILQLASELKQEGQRLFVGTNQDLVRGAFLRSQPLIQERFEKLFFSAEFGCMKPDLRFFEKVSTCLQPYHEKIVLIDDRIENIIAAKSCGWEGIHFDPDMAGTSFELLEKELLPWRNRGR